MDANYDVTMWCRLDLTIVSYSHILNFTGWQVKTPVHDGFRRADPESLLAEEHIEPNIEHLHHMHEPAVNMHGGENRFRVAP